MAFGFKVPNIAQQATDFVNTQRKKIANAGSSVPTNELLKAGIFKISRQGQIQTVKEGTFLLNPSSFQENKSTTWVQNNTPGQSDPILQWAGPGPRTVTFEALITKDTADFRTKFEDDNVSKAETFIAGIATKLFNVNQLPFGLGQKKAVSVPENKNYMSIALYLNYYRSLMYPKYDVADNPRNLRSSPPLVVLIIGDSLSPHKYDINNGKINSTYDLWVVTNLSINVTKQTPNLSPMEAVVSFTLMQYNIKSHDSRRFFIGEYEV